MTDLSICESSFEKFKKKAREEFLKEESNGLEELKENPEIKSLSFTDKVVEEPALEYLEIDEDSGNINFTVSNDLYYLDHTINLSDDNFCKLISIAIKRLNKFKNVLESLK